MQRCGAVGCLGFLAQEKRRMVTSTQTEELAIYPSELHALRREEDVQAVCLKHHKSDARLLGAVNLREHACDAKWVMCHAAVKVVLDRECARRRRGSAFTRKKPASKQRAPTQGLVQTTRVTTRR